MHEIEVSTTVYRTIDGIDLPMHVFRPSASSVRAAAVFFHGGGLTTGSPGYFQPECEYLASRGMVAASAAYRLLPNQARSVSDCVVDAQAAIAWVRENAGREVTRVAAIGFSAGGLLAGATAFDAPLEEFGAPCRPDAVVFLNAVVDATWPTKAANCNLPPPPLLVLHGRRDTLASFSRARRFANAMAAAGHSCEVVEFDGAHTFHRPYAKNGSGGVIGVLKSMDRFFTGLGYLAHDDAADERIEAIGEAMLADVLARRRSS